MIDWTKPIEYVDANGKAWPAKLKHTLRGHVCPYLVVVTHDDREEVHWCNDSGTAINNWGAAVRNAPPKPRMVTIGINVYPDRVSAWCSVDDAKNHLDRDTAIAAIAVEVVEGRFDY